MDAWVGWLVFALVGLLIIGFSYGFVAYYKMRGEPSAVTTIIGFLSLLFTLLSLFLIPIDIYMAKNKDNYAKSGLRNEMKYTYYAFDIVFMIFVFIGIPFAYFYYEELGDLEDKENTFKKRACNALKYTVCTAILWLVLMFCGLFINFRNTKGGCDQSKEDNQKDSDCWKNNVTKRFSSNSSRILPFCMATLMCIGLFFSMIYTAWGMASLPISIMRSMSLKTTVSRDSSYKSSSRSSRNNRRSSDNPDIQLRKIEDDLDLLESKYRGQSGEWRKGDVVKKKYLIRKKERLQRKVNSNSMSSRQFSTDSMNRGNRDIESNYNRNNNKNNNNNDNNDSNDCCGKCGAIIWNLSAPIRYLIGMFLIAFSGLLIVSMGIHLVDQAVNSDCGYNCGFSLDKNRYTNPISYVLQQTSKYFPIDYIVFSGVIFWLFLTTISGLMAIDVRFLCFRLFKLRAHNTMQNALMMAVGFVVLVVASLTYMTYNLAPDYVSYGSQGVNKTCNTDKCTATAIYYILNGITIGLPIFGLIYFILSWIFIVVFILSLIVNIMKSNKGKDRLLLDDDDKDLEAVFKD